jgi:hypothetical protein
MPLARQREQKLEFVDHAVPRSRITLPIRPARVCACTDKMVEKLANSQHIDSVGLSTYVRLGIPRRRCVRRWNPLRELP